MTNFAAGEARSLIERYSGLGAFRRGVLAATVSTTWFPFFLLWVLASWLRLSAPRRPLLPLAVLLPTFDHGNYVVPAHLMDVALIVLGAFILVWLLVVDGIDREPIGVHEDMRHLTLNEVLEGFVAHVNIRLLDA